MGMQTFERGIPEVLIINNSLLLFILIVHSMPAKSRENGKISSNIFGRLRNASKNNKLKPDSVYEDSFLLYSTKSPINIIAANEQIVIKLLSRKLLAIYFDISEFINIKFIF